MPPVPHAHRQQILEILQRAGLTPGVTVRAAGVVLPSATGRATPSPVEDGSLTWTLTTEAPATVWDWDRWDFVDEVLLMEGVELPEIRQVPLLDTHSRYSVDDHLGSVDQIRRETRADGLQALVGQVRFAADEKSQRTRQKVIDGHLTDGSVGYRVTRSLWVPEDTEAVVAGKVWAGPLKLSQAWILKEFSITPIGADALAKVRSVVHHTALPGGRTASSRRE